MLKTSSKLRLCKFDVIPALKAKYIGPRSRRRAYMETLSCTGYPTATSSSHVLRISSTYSETKRVPFEEL